MDTANSQFCFTHPGGEDIYLFRLYNSKGTEVSLPIMEQRSPRLTWYKEMAG